MKERLCVWQDSIVATNFNTIVSFCKNEKCPTCSKLIFADLCKKCAHRKPIIDDSVYDSLKLDSFIENGEQPKKDIEKILATPCEKCQ